MCVRGDVPHTWQGGSPPAAVDETVDMVGASDTGPQAWLSASVSLSRADVALQDEGRYDLDHTPSSTRPAVTTRRSSSSSSGAGSTSSILASSE